MTKQEIFKTHLYNLLKKDIAIEIYNQQNNTIIFSFFHLESVYNGLIWYDISTHEYNINFQYHEYSKTLEKSLEKLLACLQWFRMDYIEKEMDFYRKAAQKIFESKYSLDIVLHTINE